MELALEATMSGEIIEACRCCVEIRNGICSIQVYPTKLNKMWIHSMYMYIYIYIHNIYVHILLNCLYNYD